MPPTDEFERFAFRAMGGPCAVHLRRGIAAPAVLRSAAEAAIAEVRRIETKYSRYRDDSVVSQINATAGSGQGVSVDEETAGLLDYAGLVHRESEGLFDATSGVLRRVWDFKSGRLPAREDVEALLPKIGWQHVDWRRPEVSLTRPGMELDFGGFGKEYAVDRAVAAARAVDGRLEGLVDLAGDAALLQALPPERAYSIGVRDPRRPERAAASVALAHGAVATSGDYERCMVVEGRRYSHLLDPHTGWPVRGPLASCTVIADQCLVAGSATTIAMLRGAKRGSAFLDALGLPSLRIHADGSMSGRLASGARTNAPKQNKWMGPAGTLEAA